jgi:hypothetical protein
MSLKKKLTEVATAAAQEATHTERGRCLWVLSRVIAELKEDFEKKLLAESQRELARIKMSIAAGIFKRARRHIVAGTRPPVVHRDDNGEEP